MTLEQYIEQLKLTRQEVLMWAIETAQEVAEFDAAAQIVSRVQETGKDAKGNAFSEYSEAYKKWKKEKRGQINDFKDFTLEGEMWGEFGIISTKTTNRNIKIKLGGRNADSAKKINYNSAREKISIIEISEAESAHVINVFDNKLFQFLQIRL